MVSGSSSSTSGATTRLRHVWCTWRPGRLFHSPSPTRTSTGCTSLRGSRRAASAILHRGRATRGLTRGQASRPCLRGGADRHPKIHFGVLGGPLLAIEFDGLGHGFSRHGRYFQRVPTPRDKRRAWKLNLKARVANEAAFPFVILSYDEKEVLEEVTRL